MFNVQINAKSAEDLAKASAIVGNGMNALKNVPEAAKVSITLNGAALPQEIEITGTTTMAYADDVVMHMGIPWRKVERKVVVDEFIIITESNDSEYAANQVYYVHHIDSVGDIYAVGNGTDSFIDMVKVTYVVLEPLTK